MLNSNDFKVISDLYAILHRARHGLRSLLSVHGNAMPNIASLHDILGHRSELPTIFAPDVRVFAQFGEDIIVKSILQAAFPDRYENGEITYLDAGANHPINMSNTWLLYKDGHRGVLVEPNLELCDELSRVRSEDVVLQCALSDTYTTEQKLYLHKKHELSSLDFEFSTKFHSLRGLDPQPLREVVVPTEHIGDVLAKHFPHQPPDFISIDLEGFDLRILRQIDFTTYSPAIICIEPSDELSPEGEIPNSIRIRELLQRVGYILISKTPANLIFVKIEVIKPKANTLV
ncbi:FkbM family methyltransferase [Pseudovibrio sp. Ad26]|uniref:FkbM family methyltransferase n=1 Tax=Pseudovibrio sp. Ad26 TaxID=989410 RepID=UPI0007B3016E|nr:FkbM family methyltransferase [Pseudovibrio sp. Ad26]KZL16318.1 hypothetical protein PsAD26_00357 [Pseudovibrio sp. Ad26]